MRARMRRVRCFVLLFLVLQAIYRPWNSLQAWRLDLASTRGALAVGAVCNPFQGILHFSQSLRCEGIFLQGLRRALRGGGVISRISDSRFSGIARFASQACHLLDKLPFFFEQPLFEGFGIHGNLSIERAKRFARSDIAARLAAAVNQQSTAARR
jgi:hypothetical protein